MIYAKCKSIDKAIKKTLKLLIKSSDLKGDPKNYKDSSAVIILENYEVEAKIGIQNKSFISEYDYDKLIPGGNNLMAVEISHYNKELLLSNKLQEIVEFLKKDRFSKKAVLMIWPGLEKASIPCVIYLWFRIKNNYLDMNCHMRANNAFSLFLMDLHVMTTIHNYVAQELNLPKGNYHHFVDSLHLYERERRLVENLLKLDNEFPK